jgi:hypothetical protein
MDLDMLLKLSIFLVHTVYCACFVPQNVHCFWNMHHISVRRTHVQCYTIKFKFKPRIVELTYANVLLFDQAKDTSVYVGRCYIYQPKQ